MSSATRDLVCIVDYSDSDGEQEMSEDDVMHVSVGRSATFSASIVRSILADVISAAVKADSPAMETYRSWEVASDDSFSDSESSSEEESESSSSSSTSESENDFLPEESISREKGQRNRGPKTKGEVKPIDLPPIEDLQISVPEAECVQIGTISSVVDDLVVVKAFPNTPALDLDSIFFLDVGKRPLGQVFDVLGPVMEPYYTVRFNSSEHIKQKDVSVGQPVFCAPRTEYTSFVFVDQLRKLKGSDASWRHDEEPPMKLLEFSDDEEERKVKKDYREKKLADKQSNSHVPTKRTRNDMPAAPITNNPFYRQSRRYNPRDYGPIHWNSMHTPPPTYPPRPLPQGCHQLNSFLRPSAFGQHFSEQSSHANAGFPLPNPFNLPPPSSISQGQIVYSNHAFRYPPPPPPE